MAVTFILSVVGLSLATTMFLLLRREIKLARADMRYGLGLLRGELAEVGKVASTAATTATNGAQFQRVRGRMPPTGQVSAPLALDAMTESQRAAGLTVEMARPSKLPKPW